LDFFGYNSKWNKVNGAEEGYHCTGLKKLLDDLQMEVDIFISSAPAYFINVFTYYEYKHFRLASKKTYCEFNYIGLDLIVGKKTFNGHVMMMVIGSVSTSKTYRNTRKMVLKLLGGKLNSKLKKITKKHF
jgi:hypothetical protein